jgi:DNA polymerase-3 subunit beta
MDLLLENEHDEETKVKSKVISFNIENDEENNELMNALLVCAKVVPTSSAVPILQCIKFDLKGNTLFITATDITQSVLLKLKVENEGNLDGSYLFPAKEGIELVKRLPKGKLTFTKEESTVCIAYGTTGKAKLKVLSSDEYPPLPALEAADVISVPIEVLRKGALASRFSSNDEKMPASTGIHIFNHEGKIGFESTDRHRIFRYISDVAIINQDTFVDSLIHALSFKQIVDSLKDTKQVDLILTKSYIVMRDKNIVYFGSMINATFYDLTRVFDGIGKGTTVTLPRGELDATLNRALSLDATNNRVTLEVNEEGVFVLHTQSENSELYEGFANAKLDGEFPAMKFNGRYIRDALLSGEREVRNVILRVSGSRMPGFVTMDGDPSVTVVINPVI